MSANAEVLRPSCSAAISSLPQASGQADVPSPAFLASVVAAIKQALAADQTPPSVAASSSSAEGVPTTFSSSLQSQASALAVSGVGFPPTSASIARAANQMQGRPNFVVPYFVSTFSPPAPSVAPSLSSVAAGLLPTALSSSPNVSLPVLQQSFVVAPGFSPVLPKLVSQIVSGKFVELSELLSSNIVQTQSDSDPQLFFDGRLVLTSTPKKLKRRIEDIGSWLEAFSVYCLVLTSQFPQWWKDLQLYQLLILRTYRQFTGRVWLAYDRAFREHAAATNLTDWSTLNVQLFNFHAAGASVRGHDAVTDSTEPRGAASSTVICRSWNRGQCVAPFASCHFAHKCQSCFGHHRVKDCPGTSSSQHSAESKRLPASPPRSCSKSRRSWTLWTCFLFCFLPLYLLCCLLAYVFITLGFWYWDCVFVFFFHNGGCPLC